VAGLTGIFIGYQIISNVPTQFTFVSRKWHSQKSCGLFFEFGGQVHSDSGIEGQSAVCLDPGLAPPSGLCNIYSFSESSQRSFEEIMEVYGCDVYVFNPFSLPIHKKSNDSIKSFPHMHFFQFGLVTQPSQQYIKEGNH